MLECPNNFLEIAWDVNATCITQKQPSSLKPCKTRSNIGEESLRGSGQTLCMLLRDLLTIYPAVTSNVKMMWHSVGKKVPSHRDAVDQEIMGNANSS